MKHFEQVTLIERDLYPELPVFRPGVPQGRQVHTMLLKGQQVLEALFPGLEKKLLADGAIERAYGNQTLSYYGDARCPCIPPLLRGWNCSRLLLEWQIRQEMITSPHLKIIEGQEVIGLLFDQSTCAVNGVRFRARNHQHPAEQVIQEMTGNLVIDASGSTSCASQWLEALGYSAPKETVIDVSLGYATRYYAKPSTAFEWKGITIQGGPPDHRGAVLMEIENNQWMVVLAGLKGDHPPTDEEGYLEFAKSLPEPALYESIKNATPLSPIYGYRRTENRFRHFERLQRLPEQFLLIGDAVCYFNPVYGQGMTVAALEAQVLDACLQKDKEQQGFALRFQKKIARLIAGSWQLATAADARIAGQETNRNYLLWYLERFNALLSHDEYCLITFYQILHMLRSPLVLLHPKILAKVLTYRKELAS
jgi:2-polyprenyl-6-methoxyphenol hydroxylase-like FAD-dependent oxidoreductase